MLNSPNIDSAKTTIKADAANTTQACCNHTVSSARQSGNNADQRISQSQTLNINDGQHKRPRLARLFVADHNTGNNRQQGIHTGGKTQTQTGEKKRQKIGVERIPRQLETAVAALIPLRGGSAPLPF